MTTLIINEKKNTIEMSKTFAATARKFGTKEYNQLQQARRDYPDFKVTVVSRNSGAKKEIFKGLTYEYMEKYIEAHDGKEHSVMNEYLNLRALSDEAQAALAEPVSYGELKNWFLMQYPAIANFHKKRAEMLASNKKKENENEKENENNKVA